MSCVPDAAQSKQPASLFGVPVDSPMQIPMHAFLGALCWKRTEQFMCVSGRNRTPVLCVTTCYLLIEQTASHA